MDFGWVKKAEMFRDVPRYKCIGTSLSNQIETQLLIGQLEWITDELSFSEHSAFYLGTPLNVI